MILLQTLLISFLAMASITQDEFHLRQGAVCIVPCIHAVELRNGDLMSAWFGGSAGGESGCRRLGLPPLRRQMVGTVRAGARAGSGPATIRCCFYTRTAACGSTTSSVPRPPPGRAGVGFSTDDGGSWSQRSICPPV